VVDVLQRRGEAGPPLFCRYLRGAPVREKEHEVTERKTWLITGAGRGLGVDLARAALGAGHSVIATGRDAAKVAAAIGDQDNLLALRLDVRHVRHDYPVLGRGCMAPNEGRLAALCSAWSQDELGMARTGSCRSDPLRGLRGKAESASCTFADEP
jgi:hypothetical protein